MLELSGHIAMQEEAAFKLKIWPVTSFYNHGAVMFSSCSNDARNLRAGASCRFELSCNKPSCCAELKE